MYQYLRRVLIISAFLFPLLLYILFMPIPYHVVQENSERFLRGGCSDDEMLAKLQKLQKAITSTNNSTAVDLPNKNHEIIFKAEEMPALPSVPYMTSHNFSRLLGRGDHQTVLKLMSILDEIVESVGGKLIMYYGTLLGSYMCHNILPWDDDVDFLITVSSKKDLKKKLQEGKNGTFWDIDYKLPDTGMMKVWFTDSPNAGQFKWKFPFVDAWFLDYNKTHAWSYDERGFNVPISDFFPLHKRPLGHIYLNSPRKVRSFLKDRYKKFKCKSHFWDHRNEHAKTQITIPCENLKKYYPYVLRHKLPHGVRETLMIDGKPYYSLDVSEEYDGYIAPFSFDAL